MAYKMDLTGYILAFDLDGTLVDSAPDIIGALNKVLVEQGITPFHLDEARPMIGRGAMELLRRAYALAGRDLVADQEKPLLKRMLDLYEADIYKDSRAYPDLVKTLDKLEAAGARFCVCTNKHTYLAIELLKKIGIYERFGSVRGADTVRHKKPAAGHLKACIDEMSGDMTRVIMIGDSETDYLTAKAADVPCILFTFGYSERGLDELSPHALLSAYSALPKALETCLKTA